MFQPKVLNPMEFVRELIISIDFALSATTVFFSHVEILVFFFIILFLFLFT